MLSKQAKVLLRQIEKDPDKLIVVPLAPLDDVMSELVREGKLTFTSSCTGGFGAGTPAAFFKLNEA